MKNISRNTKVVKIHNEEEQWQKIYKRGRETAREFKIISEEDIERILHNE